ncbi:PilZ domain-containing protein [Devosia rhizoryzae]|uniref:PilZ domain-containing protein n=1 Tax=Devosia rhizoryzae TaxID=2774137 RepID=A0ABX7C928_9HYPH|nr:PilZ domain-containing protein [Devosia rhizoryzae]QQR40777.1 hypothetical protein JI748_07215 [Devosia rhizoryzae]
MAEVLEHVDVAVHGIRTVSGRYAIGGDEGYPGINLFACRLRMMSSDAFRVTAPVIPAPGESILASLGPFGALRGHVERQFEDGFVVGIEHQGSSREDLNRAIKQFTETLWTEAGERRGAKRLLPRNPRTVFARPDNWSQPCLVMDYSVTGAAISSAFQPAVGEVVTVGTITAEVVRLFDVGFAVRFFEQQSEDDVEAGLQAPNDWEQMLRRAFEGR